MLMEQQIRSFGLEPGTGGSAQAIIAPHGAWDLSGAVAASAFAAAAGRTPGANGAGVSTVVILGTSYGVAAPGIFLSDSDYFITPLGNIPVDLDLSGELASCSTLLEVNDIPHLQEHTLEVLLPFIKFCFPNASIVPVLTSHPLGGRRAHVWSSAQIASLAQALRIIFEPLLDHTLFVVSANLSKHDDDPTALAQAEECVRLLASGSSGEFFTGIYEDRISPCGGQAVAALLASGLLDGKTCKLVSGPLVKTRAEDNRTVYYGGLAFV
jgi:AmmeMemoRadiSam system protein B